MSPQSRLAKRVALGTALLTFIAAALLMGLGPAAQAGMVHENTMGGGFALTAAGLSITMGLLGVDG